MGIGNEHRLAAGVSFVWADLPPLVEALDGVARDVEQLHFRRQKKSHVGIGSLSNLKHLWVHKADQSLIDEISGLPKLETLHVRGMTAISLEPLSRLRRLRRLILMGGSKIEDLDWTPGLSEGLKSLFLEGFTKVSDIAPLAQRSGLTALGFEGGIDTKVNIDTLAPLSKLTKLRWLFLASARVADRSLAPLAKIASLEVLECTARFPDAEFIALRNALPRLQCDWIRMIEQHGSLRKWNEAFKTRLKGG